MPSRRMMVSLAAGLAALLALVLGPSAVVGVMARNAVTTPQSAPSAPVALVLGASVRADGTPSAVLRDRLDTAVDLYRSGRAKVLLVSGDNRTTDYNEPTAMRNYLVRQGIPAAQVVEDFAGRNTYDSCYRAQAIFGVTHLLVVSQRYHLPRAVATCRALGMDVTGVAGTVSGHALSQPSLREVPASLKLVLDLVTSRRPVLGSPEVSVAWALGDSAMSTVPQSH